MTWAEFRLRLFSYHRQEKNQLLKLRRLAWVSYIAPHQDPKKLRGMKEDRWWRIGEAKKVDNRHKERFIAEMVKYLNKKDGGIKC